MEKIENEISSLWSLIKAQERGYFKLKKVAREVEEIAIDSNDSHIMDVYYELVASHQEIDEKIAELTRRYKELKLLEEAGFERKAGFFFAFEKGNVIILKDSEDWAILVDNGIHDFYTHTDYVCSSHDPRDLGDVLYEAERLL